MYDIGRYYAYSMWCIISVVASYVWQQKTRRTRAAGYLTLSSFVICSVNKPYFKHCTQTMYIQGVTKTSIFMFSWHKNYNKSGVFMIITRAHFRAFSETTITLQLEPTHPSNRILQSYVIVFVLRISPRSRLSLYTHWKICWLLGLLLIQKLLTCIGRYITYN